MIYFYYYLCMFIPLPYTKSGKISIRKRMFNKGYQILFTETQHDYTRSETNHIIEVLATVDTIDEVEEFIKTNLIDEEL